MTRTYRSWPLAMLAALGLMLATAGAASAHADLKSAVPAPDSTVAAAPGRVTIVFTEELKEGGNTITVTDASGAVVSEGAVTLERSDPDRATVSVALKPNLPAGRYTVAWENTSADGHSEEGSYSFTVGAGSAASAPASLPRTAGADPAPLAALAAALALGLGALARRRAAHQREA